MNERIRELAAIARGQAIVGTTVDEEQWKQHEQFVEKFAELIIEQCCRALNPMLRDMISRGQGRDLILEHFGFMFDRKIKHLDQQLAEQEPGWICSKCGVDRIRDVCPKGHTAALSGECPMTGVASLRS